MPSEQKSVLILDDDPEHLKIYGWLMQQAGFAPVACLVRRSGPVLNPDTHIDLVLLDYVLNCDIPTPEVARQVHSMWPKVPLVLLSDIHGLPETMAPVVDRFVRKGEPAKLMATISDLLGRPEIETAAG
jgi:DNA-binding NtrC family response regulator